VGGRDRERGRRGREMSREGEGKRERGKEVRVSGRERVGRVCGHKFAGARVGKRESAQKRGQGERVGECE
jgi:hypothetical protein